MKKLFIGMPGWYVILLGILYALPLPMPIICSVFVLVPQGLTTFLGAFVGVILIGYMMAIPFFCMYYAVITFFHAVLDEFFLFPGTKMRKILFCLLTLVCSIALFVSSMLTIYLIEADENLYSFIALLGMLFSFGAMFATMIARFVTLRFRKSTENFSPSVS